MRGDRDSDRDSPKAHRERISRTSKTSGPGNSVTIAVEDRDSDGARSWKDQARYSAHVMLAAARDDAPRSTQGVLDHYLRQIPIEQQAAAADALRDWCMKYCGPDWPRVSDELTGTRVETITHPALRGRPTRGRWGAPGLSEAITAVRLRMAEGVGVKAACRDVAGTIEDVIGAIRLSADTERASAHARAALPVVAADLARKLYDAYRRVNSAGAEVN